jgi:hypothetical protein
MFVYQKIKGMLEKSIIFQKKDAMLNGKSSIIVIGTKVIRKMVINMVRVYIIGIEVIDI